MQVSTTVHQGSRYSLAFEPYPARNLPVTIFRLFVSIFSALVVCVTPSHAQPAAEEMKSRVQGIEGTIAASGSGSSASVMEEAERRLREAKQRAKDDTEMRRMVEGKVGQAVIAAKKTKEARTPAAVVTGQPTTDPSKLMSIDEKRIAEAYDFSRWEARYYAPLKKLEGLPSTIVRHLRGKSGGNVVAIPSKEEITAYERTLPPPNGPSTRMRGFTSFSQAPGVRFPYKPGTTSSDPVDLKNLPDCAEDRVEVRPTGYDGKAGDDVLNDVLHLRRSHRGAMPDEGFGRAQIIEYAPGSPSFEAFRDASFGLRCLPWRMRVTREKVTIYEGKEALKHYE